MIYRKMYWYKIHNDSDFILMAGIDQRFEVVSGSVSGRRTKKSGGLITPGFVARIFV